MMKVVPSAYHQSLDVFAKVTSEKLPPHDACEHHIELKGSLPPVGVIYSLSNQESDTLRAYISQNLDKVFIQPSSSSTAEPVLFVKKKDGGLSELNYEIHDKELLGIVWAFVLSLCLSCEVLTDHSSLQYFMSSKVLTLHQACWADFLSEFYFSTTYCPGCLATIPDALSCWDNIYPERGEDFISKNPMNFQQLIKQDEVQPSSYFAVKVESFSNLIDSIQKALCWTPWPREDSQTFQAGFPLVQNDSIHQGLCLILSIVLKKQEYPSQEVWTPQTSSNSTWSFDLSFN
ncbi:hypothetical protein O181_039348 [Austropuccinia psidii MF-1]|uniref:Reverse transcriptase RNase H-like domain-containing protein n=1 Tax=Austropuccinia psidii MF-1 TaxID=1389203 RepID=A0A9Q3DF67_9BASI|nr:hypothetical protein [Austropuccinia psidii MF-1]